MTTIISKAARRSSRRAARAVRKLGNTTARIIATNIVPATRKAGNVLRAVAKFLFAHAPKGLAIVVIGWLKLIPSKIPIWVGAKLAISAVVAFFAFSALSIIGFQLATGITQALGLYYSDVGRARVLAVVGAGMWLAVWALFGIIGRHATAPGNKDGGLTGDTKTIARALEVVLASDIQRAMALSGGQPALWLSPLQPEYDDNGQRTGRSTTITLPMGATFDRVKPKLIAQALHKPSDRISVTEGAHPGEARVFVADKSPSELPAKPWPLAGADRLDITRPVPIGVTHDGTRVAMSLFRVNEGRINGGSMLIGGTTDTGKTSFLRMLISAAALDPRTVIAVADFKGDDDYSGMAPALHWHRVKPTADNIAALGVMLGQVLDHMDAITDGRAERVPILIVVDEAHTVLGTGKNPEVARQLELVITQGRSFGVYVILAAQRPTKEAISTDLSANLRDRVAFKVVQQATGEVVVGTQPADQNPFLFKVGDQGLAMAQLIGFDGKVQTFYVNGKAAERIAKAHPAGGDWFGTAAPFPTYALDHDNQVQDPDPDALALLRAHVDALWNDDNSDGGMSLGDVQAGLAAAHPHLYGGMGRAELRGRLHAAGLTSTPTGQQQQAPGTVIDHIWAAWPTDSDGQRLPNAWLDHLLSPLQGDPATAAIYDGWDRAKLRQALRGEGLEPREKVRIGDRGFPGITLKDLEVVRGGSGATRTARTP